MYARVARWEGATAEALRTTGTEMAERAPTGPPEGVPANGFTMLMNPEDGTSLAISFFATEEDLRKGDEALNAMNPMSGPEAGKRTSVETFEVASTSGSRTR